VIQIRFQILTSIRMMSSVTAHIQCEEILQSDQKNN